MSSEQYRVGHSSVTPGQTTVTGYSTVWLTNIIAADVYKPNIDSQPTAVVGSVDSDTQLTLSGNWGGTTVTYKKYMIQRAFSTNLDYARPYQGDADLADLLREQVVDKLDTDVWSALHLLKSVQKGADYTVPSGCTFNWIIATAGITVTLSAATSKRILCFSKSSGNTIIFTIQGAGADTIAGANKAFLTTKNASMIIGADGGVKWYKLSGVTY